jgi:hypothetical protein
MMTEKNNFRETFCQNMIEFLQTDIDGSLDFLLNPIITDTLEKYVKMFYTPPLDITKFILFVINFSSNDAWALAIAATIFPLSVFTSMICITLAGGARGNCLTKKIKEVRGKNSVFIFRVPCSTLYLYLGRVLWTSAAQLIFC